MSLTIKQENFCLAYVETGNASEAYRSAYNAENMKAATVNRKATELMGNGMITARIEELRAAIQERHDVTIDSVTEGLLDCITKAKGEKELSVGGLNVMRQAYMDLAKLHGLIIDKSENKNTEVFADVTAEKADPEAWAKRHKPQLPH